MEFPRETAVAQCERFTLKQTARDHDGSRGKRDQQGEQIEKKKRRERSKREKKEKAVKKGRKKKWKDEQSSKFDERIEHNNKEERRNNAEYISEQEVGECITDEFKSVCNAN